MLTSKQRAYLRGMANELEVICQVGKAGTSPETIASIDEALEAREIIKVKVLNNCTEDIRYIASAVSERTKSDAVQVIGKTIVLYRQSSKKPIIELP